MKRRTTLVALTLALVVSIFAGCGASERDDSSSSKAVTTVTTASETTTSSEETVTTVTTASSVETAESKTEITTEATTAESEPEESKAPENASRVVLDVKNIQMLPELPRGSEITSAAMVLNYYGIECDKMDLLEYLPMVKKPASGFWVTPNDAFCGDPRESTDSYGCFSPVIIKTINDYFSANSITGYTIVDLKRSKLDVLCDEIKNGNPVIVWATNDMEEADFSVSWENAPDSGVIWAINENCLVLIGYDNEKDTVILSDPANPNGNVEYPKDLFYKAYQKFAREAIALHKT